eukprot:Rhum_TRINITY_DN18711_c0_g1::Rhum_TRINITY_DN18711_c0_g1_i1::g.168276::m.168276
MHVHVQERHALEVQQGVVQRVGEDIRDVLGNHRTNHHVRQVGNVTSDLNDDDTERKGQTRNSREEACSTKEGKDTWVHPRVHTLAVGAADRLSDVADHEPVEPTERRTHDKHRDYQSARQVRAGGPAGEGEVQEEPHRKRAVAEHVERQKLLRVREALVREASPEQQLDALLGRRKGQRAKGVVLGLGVVADGVEPLQVPGPLRAGVEVELVGRRLLLAARRGHGEEHQRHEEDENDNRLEHPTARRLVDGRHAETAHLDVDEGEEGAEQPANDAEEDHERNTHQVNVLQRVRLEQDGVLRVPRREAGAVVRQPVAHLPPLELRRQRVRRHNRRQRREEGHPQRLLREERAHLLHHEEQSADRRAEGTRDTRARTTGDEVSVILRVAEVLLKLHAAPERARATCAQPRTHQRTNVDDRSLGSDGQPSCHGEGAGQNLARKRLDVEHLREGDTVEVRHDVRYAGTSRVRPQAADACADADQEDAEGEVHGEGTPLRAVPLVVLPQRILDQLAPLLGQQRHCVQQREREDAHEEADHRVHHPLLPTPLPLLLLQAVAEQLRVRLPVVNRLELRHANLLGLREPVRHLVRLQVPDAEAHVRRRARCDVFVDGVVFPPGAAPHVVIALLLVVRRSGVPRRVRARTPARDRGTRVGGVQHLVPRLRREPLPAVRPALVERHLIAQQAAKKAAPLPTNEVQIL